MSSRWVRGPLVFSSGVVSTAAGDYVMTNEAGLTLNKASGAATAVTLPPSPVLGQCVFVKDGKGDAATNNITVSGAAAATIDGQASHVINANYACAVYQFNGTEWGLFAIVDTSTTGTGQFNAIIGTDSSLGITGQAGTGTGGNGGAVAVAGGAATAGTTTTAGGIGGALTRAAAAGGAKTGTGAAAGGAGGSITDTTGAGGNTASSSTNAGGAGGTYSVTTGNGGNATAGTGNGGQAGSVVLAAGTGGTSAGGSAGIDGCVIVRGLTFARKISAPAAKTTTTTLTVAELLGGLITANQGGAGAATYTLPTGTLMQAALPTDFTTGDSFDFSIVNISTNAAEDVTVAGDTGMTAVGNMTIASNAAVTDQAWGTFRVRKTGSNAFSFYRIG